MVLSSFLQGFELEKLLPSMPTYLGGFIFWMFFLILLGPLVMLGFGALYRYKPTQEINHKMGFRLNRKITAQNVWDYTQRLAGTAYLLVGGAMAGAFALVGIALAIINTYALVVGTLVMVIIEAVLIAGLWLGINLVVSDIFDDNGNVRKASKYAKIKFLKPM